MVSFHTSKMSKNTESTLAGPGRLPGRVFLGCGVVTCPGFRFPLALLHFAVQCRWNLSLRRSLIQKPPQVKNLDRRCFTCCQNFTNCWEAKDIVETNHSNRWSLLRDEDVQHVVSSPSGNCLHCEGPDWGEGESSQLRSEEKSLLVRSDIVHFYLEAPRVSFTNVKGCKTFLVLKLIRIP